MEITVKTSYKDLKLGEFLSIQSIVGSESGLLDVEVELVGMLIGLDEEAVRELPISVFKEVVKKANFLSKEPSGKVKEWYVLGDLKYKAELQIKEWTSGRFIDFLELNKKEDDVSLFIALVLTPKGKKYNERSVFDVQQDVLNHMNVEDAMGIVNFFLNLSNAFLNSTQDYLSKKNPTTLTNPSMDSMEDGNGSL